MAHHEAHVETEGLGVDGVEELGVGAPRVLDARQQGLGPPALDLFGFVLVVCVLSFTVAVLSRETYRDDLSVSAAGAAA